MAGELSIDIAGAVVDADVITLAQVASSGNNQASSQLPRMLGVVGFLTATIAVAAAAFRSPPPGTLLARYHGIGFYTTLGSAIAAGIAEMWAAQWVAVDVPTRCAVGKKLLCGAVVALVFVGGIGRFTV